MRSKAVIFLDSLLALAFSWGISYYFVQSDQEAFLIFGTILCLICTMIIIPVAWRYLNTSKPLKESLFLTFALMSLTITISHPALPIAELIKNYVNINLSFHTTWLINTCILSIIIFIFSALVLRCLDEKKQAWLSTLYTTLFVASFFLVSLYAGFMLAGI